MSDKGVVYFPEVGGGHVIKLLVQSHIADNAGDVGFGDLAAEFFHDDQVAETDFIALGGPGNPIVIAGEQAEMGHQGIKILRG
ncbi:MAG: hypothetical protein WC130_11115 [Kiritimatiellia bacterium]